MNDAKRNEKSNLWFIIGDVAVLAATLFLIGEAFAAGLFGAQIAELYFLERFGDGLRAEIGPHWWIGVVVVSVMFKAVCNLAGRAALADAKAALRPSTVFANAKV